MPTRTTSLATRRSDEYYEKIMERLDARFACSGEVRTTASTPLAPPPADGFTPRPSKTTGRVEGRSKAQPGFVIDGMASRNHRLRELRRKRELMPEKVDLESCPHDAGWQRDGRAHGLARLKCRKCGKRERLTEVEADARMAEVTK